MTIHAHGALPISLATLVLLVAGAAYDRPALAQLAWSCDPLPPGAIAEYLECVPLTFVANVQVSNLHPAVSHVQMRCLAGITNNGISATSNRAAVVNRALTGSLTAVIRVPKKFVSDPGHRSIMVGCQLQLVKAAGTPAEATALAVASATEPVGIVDSNWTTVASDSTILWTENVTFPNASAPAAVNPAPSLREHPR